MAIQMHREIMSKFGNNKDEGAIEAYTNSRRVMLVFVNRLQDSIDGVKEIYAEERNGP